MIPAILSCVFVLYLYRVLNAPAGDGRTGVNLKSDSIESLKQRIEAARQRIERMSHSSGQGEPK